MPLTPGTKEVYLGALLGNIIYGFYLSAFVECCVVFVRVKEERTDARQKYIIFTAALMFLLITTRCIINTYRCVAAFNVAEDFVGIGNPDSTLDLIANACWFLLTAFADAFIIFRTYIVWERNWLVIIIPVLLCLANLGSSIWLMTALADLKFSPTVWESIAYKSMNLFLVLTLCTNIICTALISFRILRIYREVSSTSRMYRMRAVSAVVESAAIYTLVLVGALIGNGMNSYVNFVFFYCVCGLMLFCWDGLALTSMFVDPPYDWSRFFLHHHPG
ncbi:hypothetical protein MSAN_00086600 [Mycena sanguinolenta]|uniref:Uncharacterized protein n=1 Tax=Mycena sanguinolenta TaxID=230812 RepID=A0A8H6ZGY9_9AGAR|nr:hypothetical protein MSAN_00086600 [Mycena sanguinolenta]